MSELKTHAIENTNGQYIIDELGRVFSVKNNCYLSNYFDKSKNVFRTKIDGKNTNIHNLLAKYFISNPNNYKFIRFADGDRTNISLDNLIWAETQFDSKPKEPKKEIIIKTIDEVERKENELFVSFNHEIYNHYLISNYGRVFNTRSGNLYEYKQIFTFRKGEKNENDYSVNVIVLNHFDLKNIQLTMYKSKPNETWVQYEKIEHVYISNYGRVVNLKTSIVRENKATHGFNINGNEFTLNMYHFLYKNFDINNIYFDKIEKNHDDEEFKLVDTTKYNTIENSTYIISNYGNIYSLNHCKIIKIKLDLKTNGYYEYKFNKQTFRVHRLVAEYFLPKPETDDLVVNHIDGNKLNNYYKNLEYVTISENNKHALENGLTFSGKREVYQLNENMKIINLFESILDASKSNGLNINNKKISAVCHLYKKHKLLKKYHGCYFMFKEDYEEYLLNKKIVFQKI